MKLFHYKTCLYNLPIYLIDRFKIISDHFNKLNVDESVQLKRFHY